MTAANGEVISGYTGATASGGVFITDQNGEIRLNRVQPGTYTVREVQAPSGYVLDEQPQTVVLDAGGEQTVTFADAPKGSLVIRKTDSLTHAPLSGAEFRVTTADGTYVADNQGRTSSNGLFVTDEAGQIVLSRLKPGTYVVTETKAPDNYYLNTSSQTVTVNADDAQTVSFADEPFAALTIRKVDALTGDALSGAEFTVKDSGGEVIGSFTTGADGTATVSGLKPNSTVVVTETRAPEGYVLADRPQTIRVGSGRPNSLTFENNPLATLVIRKVIDGTDNEPLSGVRFQVTDGSGAAVGPDDGFYTTDAAGEIRLTGLKPGITVKAREVQTVRGYVLDGTPQDIQLLPGQEQTLTFKNKRSGSLTVKKLDGVTREPLSGVEFKITYADGRVVDTEDGLISSNGTYFTDSHGEIAIHGLVGTVVVTEVKSIEGYSMDPDSRSQTVTVRPNDGQTVTFFNNPAQSLTITKYVKGTTTPIPGTEFLLTDSTGAVIGPSGGKYVTDEDGRIVITGLTPGVTVTAKETKAADGFLLDASPKSIAIRQGEAQSMTFYNEACGALLIVKKDAVTDAPLPGAVFQVLTSNGQYVADRAGRLSSKEDCCLGSNFPSSQAQYPLRRIQSNEPIKR